LNQVLKRAVNRAWAIASICLLLSAAASLAQSKSDPLTDKEIEAVREAGDQPVERIRLFVGYIDDRAKAIHTLNADAIAQNKTARLHTLLDEFTRLSDDLQDNMDQFEDQHADMRKALKDVVARTDAWTVILNEPKPNGQYDFVRKTALDSNQGAHESAVKMIDDETKYFAELKKEQKEREKQQQKETR
jgi:hypothetical protein